MAEVRLTAAQAALTRSCLFRELGDAAEGLAHEAQPAAQEPSEACGEDALGRYRQVLAGAELLEAVGWSTRGDQELLVSAERERRNNGGAMA